MTTGPQGNDRPRQAAGPTETVLTTARQVLDDAWREPGFCVPNHDVYPHQWLWDSCFHALAWAHLGSERSITELTTLLSTQASDGFIPHMTYWHHENLHAEFWGRPGASTITQPPMYGHALAEAARLGFLPESELVDRARRGLVHLGERERTPKGLVPVYHPWETGCDDSPRWDSYFDESGDGDTDPAEWEVDRVGRRPRKGEMVRALQRSPEGHAVGSSLFEVGSISFNALVAWNAAELAAAFPQAGDPLCDLIDELSAKVRDRWNGETWVDDGPASGADSAGIRTADALTALLIDPRDEVFESLVDPDAFGAQFGPRGVHRQEPTYRPDRYWRGSTWPQLAYLLTVAARRAQHGVGDELRLALDRGATESGWAEYWHPDTGRGLGACPQTWATISVAV